MACGDEPLQAGRPFERLRLLLVVKLDEVQNRRLEIVEGIVDAVPRTAADQLPEEALDRVRPRAGRRREVEGLSAMALQPARADPCACGGVVVHDGVDLPSGGHFLLDPVEERD